MSTAKKPEKRYITRMKGKAGKGSGWWVRIGVGRSFCFQEFFSDLSHGGQEEALLAAKSVRDEMVRKMRIKYGKKNPWGKGVHLSRQVKNGKVYYAWVASWMDHNTNRQRRKNFACGKYGWDRAYELAKKWREQNVQGCIEPESGSYFFSEPNSGCSK